jgi:hypothetical protein
MTSMERSLIYDMLLQVGHICQRIHVEVLVVAQNENNVGLLSASTDAHHGQLPIREQTRDGDIKGQPDCHYPACSLERGHRVLVSKLVLPSTRPPRQKIDGRASKLMLSGTINSQAVVSKI